MDPDPISPLTPTEFIQRILVPEVAVALIMEDMNVSKKRAMKTLRESVQYGVAMFPDASNEDDEDGMGAADEIVKERARIRRKELEEEERIEDEMLAKEEAERASEAGSIKKPKGKRRTRPVQDSDAETASKVSNTGRKGRIKRKTGRDTSTEVEILSDAGVRSLKRPGKPSDRTNKPMSRRKLDNKPARDSYPSQSTDETDSGAEFNPRPKRIRKQKEKPREESEEVEIVENTTPRIKLHMNGGSKSNSRISDEDATPRPKPSKKPLAPLLQARQKRTQL